MKVQICSLNGIYYQPGTVFPVTQRFGDNAVLFNHITGSSLPQDVHGNVKLEVGGVYSTIIDRNYKHYSSSMTDQTNIHTNDVPTGFKIGGFTFGSRRNSALKTPKAATTSGINGNAHGGSGGNYSPSSSNQKLGQSPSVSSFRNMGRSASKTSINSVSVNTSLDSDLEINGSSHKASRNNSTQLSAASPAACLHHTNNHVSAPDLARIHIELEEEEGGEDVVQGRISTIDDDNNGGGDGGGGRVEIIEALEDTINTTTQEGGMKSKRNSIQKPSIKSMVLDLFKSSYKDHLLDSCLSPIEANSDNIPGTSSSRRNSRTSLSRLSRTAATSSSTENNNINPSNPSSTAVLSRSNSKKKSNATSNSLIHNDFNHLSLLDFSLREETMSMEELGGPTVRKTSASTNALSPSSKFFGESTPNIQRSLQEQGHQHQQQQSSANHNNHTTLESAGNTSLPDIGKSTLAAASSTTHSIAASSSTSLLSPSPLNAYAPQHLSLMDIHGHHSTQTHPSPSNTLQPLHGRQTSDSKRGSLKVVTFNPPSSFTSATTNRRRSSAKSGDLQPSSGSSSRINTIIQEYTIPSAESPLHGTLTMWCDDDDVGVNTFQYAAGGTGGVGGQLVDVEVNNEFVVVRQAVPLLDEIQEVLNKKNVVEIVSMPVGASCIALASNSNDSNKGGSDNNNSTFIVIVGHERYSFRASSEYDALKWIGRINTACSYAIMKKGEKSPYGQIRDGPGFETYRYELRMLLERLNIKYLQSDRNPSPLRSLAAAMDQDRDDMPSDSDSLFEMTALRIRSEETVIRYESKKKDVGAEKSESSDKSSPSYIGSATLEKLIEKLANEKEPDLKYIQTFIHTFRHICEPSAILDRLTTRMRSTTSSTRRNLLSSSLNNNNSKDDQDYLTDWGMIIRLRIVALVQLWVDQFYSLDFASNPQSKKSLDDFIDHIFPRHVEEEMASNVFVLAEFHLIQKLFKDFLGFKEANMGVNASTLSTTSTANSTTGPVSITMTPPSALAIPNEDVVPHSPTKSNPTNKHTVLDFEAENLAQQLTLAEFERYIQVRPIDFLISIWGKREDATVSRALVNYDALVAGFNKVSYWVATEICTQPEMKNRVKVVEKMIKIAKCCMKLKNFNTSMAIYSGLNVSAVSRLKQTWENVESKRIKQMQQIELALAPQMNYRSYRALLDEAETSAASAASFSEADHPQACIPIFGIFIKDLTFMNDGNPKYTDKDLNLINFGKLRLMYSTVVRATRFQKLRYFFNDNSGGGAGGLSTGVLGLSSSNLTIATNNCNIGAAADYVRTLRNLSEQQLYKYSLLCEARGGQEDGRLLNKWIKE